MLDVVTIAGSPSNNSRSAAVLDYARHALELRHLQTRSIAVRDLPAEDLMYGRFDSAAVLQSSALIGQARAVIIATPIYKAAYSGVLKSFLDLLPQKALAGKLVLPIATGGSAAHMLAIDYALSPVLSALGAQTILQGVYLLDSQVQLSQAGIQLETEAAERLDRGLQVLASELAPRNGHRAVELAY